MKLTKEQYLELSDLDKVKYCIEQSLEDHKRFNSQYWKGSSYMGKCILDLIQKVENDKLNHSHSHHSN